MIRLPLPPIVDLPVDTPSEPAITLEEAEDWLRRHRDRVVFKEERTGKNFGLSVFDGSPHETDGWLCTASSCWGHNGRTRDEALRFLVESVVRKTGFA